MATTTTLDELITLTQRSAGDVRQRAHGIKSAGKGLGDRQQTAYSQIGDSITNIQEQLDAQRRLSGSLAEIVQTSGLTPAQVIAIIIAAGFRRSETLQVDLATGANTISYADPQTEGDQLHIWIRQNGAGDGTATFDPNILFCDANYITNTPDSITMYSCIALPDPDDSDILKWFGAAPANAEQLL